MGLGIGRCVQIGASGLGTGDQVIEQLGFEGEERTFWAEMGKLLALLVMFRFLAYLSLRFCYRQKLHLD